MKTDTNVPATSPAAQLMAIEVISELLISTTPLKLGATLTDHLRELTGAKIAMVMAHHPDHDELINISPARRSNLFTQPELNNFCCEKHPEELPVDTAALPQNHPLYAQIAQAGIRTMLRLPLRAGSEPVGQIVLMDIPEIGRVDEIRQIIHLLAAPIALALRNSLALRIIKQQAEELERRVADRTAQLQDAQKLLATAIANSPFPSMIYDEDDRVLQLSHSWTMYSGYTIDDIPTLSDWTERAYGERTGSSKSYIDGLFTIDQTVYNGEWSVTAKDGSKRVWEFQTTPLGSLNSGKRVLLSMATDITERKTADVELRNAKRELELFFSVVPDMLCIATTEGYFKLLNDAWVKSLGYTKQELCSKPFVEFVHPDDIDRTTAEISRQLMGYETIKFTNRYRCKDGSYRWLEWNTTPSQGNLLYAAARDITDRKLAEEALHLKNLVFDSSLAANSIANNDANITEANTMFLQLWGYTALEVIGKPVSHFFSAPENAATILTELNKTGKWAGDFIARRKDGSTFIAQSISTIVRNEAGEKIGYQSSIIDITTYKKAEAELNKRQKLESIGTLAGGIAHDFNNIMMGLFGNISLAKSELHQNHPGYAPLESAEKSMARAIRLTAQLLTFSKGGEPVKEDTSLGTLAREVAQFDLSGSNVRLLYQEAADLWPANVDKGQIQQVISNLTINARQAMPNGGNVHISLENTRLLADEIPQLTPGNYLKLTIRDEGCGIDPKFIDKIFDPYFTTKQTGNGLGLAVTYSIIKKHGGHISVISEMGRGTSFTIYLPASEKVPAPQLAAQPVPTPALKPATRILVLDDEEFIRMIIPRWLRKKGCLVETCEDPRQAIAKYKQAFEAGQPFDLMLLDLTVPGGMGGLEVLRQIQTFDPHATAVVSSGYAEGPIMANFAAHGFKGMLAKPYTEEQLNEILENVLKKADSALARPAGAS